MRAFKMLAHDFGRARRNQRTTKPKQGHGGQQFQVFPGKPPEDAGQANDQRADRQSPSGTNTIQEHPAGNRSKDIDELPGTHDGAHCTMAETKIGFYFTHQRREARHTEPEGHVAEPHAGQHPPAAGAGFSLSQLFPHPHRISKSAQILGPATDLQIP